MTLMDLDTYIALDETARDAHLESLPDDDLVALGVQLFNAREFWHAHEAWEQVWMDAPQTMRALYQGLIQIAAAFVHVQRNEYPGAVRLLESGRAKVAAYQQGSLELDIITLLTDAGIAHDRIVTLGEKRLSDFDRTLYPKISFIKVD